MAKFTEEELEYLNGLKTGYDFTKELSISDCENLEPIIIGQVECSLLGPTGKPSKTTPVWQSILEKLWD